ILVLLPIVIECTSPRTTALNHTVQLSPIVTSPTTVALSARKQFLPNWGEFPRTDLIKAIGIKKMDGKLSLLEFHISKTLCTVRGLSWISYWVSTYVPLKSKNSLDSAYAYWIEFQKEGYYPYSMDEGDKESWTKKFVQQHNSWIDSLDLKTINHFTWHTDSYLSLPTTDNAPNTKTTVLLKPYFESLEAEV